MMQRTLLGSLKRTVASRNALIAPRIVRPNVVASRMANIRFASTESTKAENEAKKPETKAPEGEATEGKTTEGEAAEAAEADPLAELNAKLVKKDKDLADMKNHYARAVADFRNLQESTKKEVQKAKDFALQKFAKDLLESIDNFGLALNSVKEDTLNSNAEVKNLYDGVNMTRNIFEKTLSKYGIEKLNPVGEPFDPNLHEAIFEIPQPDKEPGTVFHVEQHGYTLNSRVLRPAKVGLVKSTD